MTVFWDVALYIPVEIYRGFRGVHCVHHRRDYDCPDDGLKGAEAHIKHSCNFIILINI
jgi:hypothetical protein